MSYFIGTMPAELKWKMSSFLGKGGRRSRKRGVAKSKSQGKNEEEGLKKGGKTSTSSEPKNGERLARQWKRGVCCVENQNIVEQRVDLYQNHNLLGERYKRKSLTCTTRSVDEAHIKALDKKRKNRPTAEKTDRGKFEGQPMPICEKSPLTCRNKNRSF